jgi:hypothetical protein
MYTVLVLTVTSGSCPMCVEMMIIILSCTQRVSMDDSECIANHLCPVCREPRHATLDPRKAVREHIRRMSKTSAAHKVWYDQHFATHFKHGGAKIKKQEPTVQDVKDAIRCSFGEEWASRVELKS